ncbi:MAG: hypothetical protein AAB487_00555 [Patescibacteria group bacterium]
MVNINLTTENITAKAPPLFKREVVILTALLVALMIAYGGLLLYEKQVIKKTQDKNMEYAAAYKELTEGNTKAIFDFQNRLSSAGNLFSTGNQTLENLKKMETLIVPGVYINSFSYDTEKNKISLNLVAENYNLMAKQIFSFKTAQEFSDVAVSSSQLEERNVNFPITLTLNQ